ncbi:MAG: type I methionyl aminopeptidase [Elusimicrobia bacterium HGW-Elusimicrobia-2]|nr:MAG: type I methionyl aminopeptidase [Elusimicrobia bacterium HGW-Elusimicrobia-2]
MIKIKTASEIDGIRKSCKLLKKMSDMIRKHITEGRKTSDLAALAEEFIYSNQAKPAFTPEGFPSCICVSVNDEVVHGIPGDYVIQHGDLVSVDMGLILSGYYSDMAVSAVAGNASSEAQNLMDVTEQSLRKGIEQFKEGNRLGDISHAIASFAEKNGFSVVRQFTGHGIGRELHEEPQILNYGRPGTGPELKNGMVFAIEPMINAGNWEVKIDDNGWTARTSDGSLSAHFEHTVALFDGEPEVLTS